MDHTESLAELGKVRRNLHSLENIIDRQAAKIERLRAALELFIQTVNPPYPQSMALWQEHLKAATENARKLLNGPTTDGR